MGLVGLPGFLGRDLGEASLDHFFDECSWQRLVDGELDGAFGEGIGLQVVFEEFDDPAGGKEAAMLGEGGEPDDDFAVTEGGDFVADGFGGGWGKGGANGGANFLQSGAGGFGDANEVGVDGFRAGSGLGLCRGFALAWFWLFHAREATARMD
jgi:hypothetical protein